MEDVMPDRYYTAEEVHEMWWRWVRVLLTTRSSVPTSNGGLRYLGYGGQYHPASCPCTDCLTWRKADQLQNVYRTRLMGYDASIGKPWASVWPPPRDYCGQPYCGRPKPLAASYR